MIVASNACPRHSRDLIEVLNGRSVCRQCGWASTPPPPVRPGAWGCWGVSPMTHPHEPRIVDRACGFDERMTHARCAGCWRSRVQSPRDQLDALDALGDAAQGQDASE